MSDILVLSFCISCSCLFATLFQRIKDAAFTHLNGKRTPIDIKPKNLFPYLLVNIGTGVSIIKVFYTAAPLLLKMEIMNFS
jgi:pantothenate kinase